MYVFVADLDEDAAALRQQLARDDQAIPHVGEVGVDAELPGVSEGADLLWLTRRVFDFPILDVTLARRDLPVRPELDAVWRIEVDRLNFSLQPFLFSEA